MDETSTNIWESTYKIWQPTDSVLPMVHTFPKQRGSNLTIIGAITNKKNKKLEKRNSLTPTFK